MRTAITLQQYISFSVCLYCGTLTSICQFFSLSPCPYFSLDFGEQITCKTGPYKTHQGLSGPLRVTVKYGESTSVVVSENTFTYAINPKVISYSPQGSFLWSVWLYNMQNILICFIMTFWCSLLARADSFAVCQDSTDIVIHWWKYFESLIPNQWSSESGICFCYWTFHLLTVYTLKYFCMPLDFF